MNTRIRLSVALVTAALALPALAHDPSKHKHADARAPDCSQMDMSKMDMNDPVMKAMHEKCKDQGKHDDAHGHDMKDMPSMDKKNPPPKDDTEKK